MSRQFFLIALMTVLIGAASLPVSAQSGRAFYIDYASGSNSNNGTSEATPWKSAPYMQAGAGCGGAVHPYTPMAGDKFIFKGGDTWPAACFTMFINAGGSASARTYYGVCLASDPDSPCYGGTSWPSSGWTKPLWDLNYVVVGTVVWANSGISGYLTFDNIEIARQGIALGNSDVNDVAFELYYAPNTILENLYIHGWATNASVSSTSDNLGYSTGVVYTTPTYNNTRLLNSVIEDSAGYFYSGGTKINGGIGGACENCTEISGNTFHDVYAACFNPNLSCHDNEFYNFNKVLINNYDGGYIHTQVGEDDGGGNAAYYNNYFHDNYTGSGVIDACPGSPIYNNVITNSSNGVGQPPILVDTNGCPNNTEYIFNNTIDGTGAMDNCVRLFRTGATITTVYMQNNVFISSSGSCGINVQATITNFQNSNNRQMSSSEASTYGFTPSTKYNPTSSDSNIVGQGLNLSSLAINSLAALNYDVEGAPWFGASYNARGTSWDIGAYVANSPLSPESNKPNPPTDLVATVQ